MPMKGTGAKRDVCPRFLGEYRGQSFRLSRRSRRLWSATSDPLIVLRVCSRDVHGNGIPNGTGNPMGIPWEWE